MVSMSEIVDAIHDVVRFMTRVGTYHIIRPDSGLCFELRAVPNLECARAAAREEVGDLLPGEVFLLFEIDK
jgi:hypothetical protein